MTKLKLHQYQEEAVAFLMEHKKAFLMMDMGLGKTAVALEMIKRVKQPAFVFAPVKVTLFTWPEEIEKWAPELSYRVLHGSSKFLSGHEDVDILIMNYEGLPWLAKQKASWIPRIVVYDESSKFKYHNRERFALLKKMMILWADRVVCLSATPAPIDLANLWTQMYVLDRGKALGYNITAYRRKYCQTQVFPGQTYVKYITRPESERVIYKKISPVCLRLENIKMPGNVKLVHNTIYCDLPVKARKIYKQIQKEAVYEDVEAKSASSKIMKLRQIIQGGLYREDGTWEIIHKEKLKALKEFLDTSVGRPVLCCIQFKGELSMIQQELGWVPCISGGTPDQETARYISQWNSGSLPLLLCHPASISHGLNLQKGGHLILWFGLTWSLEQFSQLIGRLYRQGQRHTVVSHYLVMKGTVDERVLASLRNKEMTQKRLFEGIKQWMRKQK